MLQRINMIDTKLERLLDRIDSAGSISTAPSPESRPNQAASWDLHVDEMLGLMEPEAYLQHRCAALEHMYNNLPDPEIMAVLMRIFVNEIEWMSAILTEARTQELLSEVAMLRQKVTLQPIYLHKLSLNQVTHLIYVLAICFSIFGLGLLSSRDSSHQIAMDGRVPASHLRYFQVVLVGLRTMDTLSEPRMEFVIAMVILLCGLCSSRPPASATFLLSHTVQVALLLNLDEEPSPSLPFEEAACRVHLYALLSIHDWFSTAFIKRRPLIMMEPKRLPSVFGTDKERSKYLAPYHQMKLRIAHLYCRTSSLMMPSDEDYAYVQQLHSEAQALQEQMLHLQSDVDQEEAHNSMKHVHRTFGNTSLHYLMIRIHLPYYMRGWDDPKYRLSRDACFTSARALLRIFRDAFSWKMPKNESGESCEAYIPTEFPVASRMWFFSHWCTAAAVLLLKHVTLLNERYEQPSWDLERESIVQDLCIMSRLLNYLAPVSSIAREGYDAMQRVAAHIMQTDFDTSQNVQDNCVTHWADRIMPSLYSRRAKAEPMLMLKSLVCHTEYSATQNRKESAYGTQDTSAPPREPHALSQSSTSSTTPASSTDRVPTMPDLGAVSPIPTSDLDTFWAKFAAPNVSDQVPANLSDDPLTMQNELLAPSSFLLPPQNLLHMPPDTFSMVNPKDMLMGNPLNFNIGSIGPFTDDFLRSLDNYAKSGSHSTAMPLP
ncbi:hypothetical protein MNAN1_003879 [Malassezia nana]|uniref:Transcription factor domain-containing protein n=1 Tax=Malassezia nana TaxID=180528 RepID=A0AAF0EN03_9BASI|nr:hypothetical protein MNAN1_003879 [Malassezia nana]